MSAPPPLTLTGEAVIQQEIKLDGHSFSDRKLVPFHVYYEIAATAAFIRQNGACRVALQFPDELLEDAHEVSSVLLRECNSYNVTEAKGVQPETEQGQEEQEKSGEGRERCQFFILADTTCGSCCVDEVAAEHVKADLIVHYGHACLSPTRRLPVRYVLGKGDFNAIAMLAVLQESGTENCLRQLLETPLTKDGGQDSTRKQFESVLVLYDLTYEACVSSHLTLATDIATSLSLPVSNVIVAAIHKQCNDQSTSSPSSPPSSSNVPFPAVPSAVRVPCLGGYLVNWQDLVSSSSSDRDNSGPSTTAKPGELPSSCLLLYIGEESATLTNLLLNCRHNPIISYNPTSTKLRVEGENINRLLARRYYLMSQVKDSEIIGIVVGTLAVDGYLAIIRHLQTMITEAGKKWYMIVVGKLNDPKLANFSEIDMFVLVACPLSTMFDSRGFIKQVVSPLECEIALVDGREWTGEYTTQFAALLPGGRLATSADTLMEPESNDAEEGVRYSTITGKIVSTQTESASDLFGKDVDQTTALTAQTTTLSIGGSRAREFMEKRTFKGLNLTENAEAGETHASIDEGLSGIARDYHEYESVISHVNCP